MCFMCVYFMACIMTGQEYHLDWTYLLTNDICFHLYQVSSSVQVILPLTSQTWPVSEEWHAHRHTHTPPLGLMLKHCITNNMFNILHMQMTFLVTLYFIFRGFVFAFLCCESMAESQHVNHMAQRAITGQAVCFASGSEGSVLHLTVLIF